MRNLTPPAAMANAEFWKMITNAQMKE